MGILVIVDILFVALLGRIILVLLPLQPFRLVVVMIVVMVIVPLVSAVIIIAQVIILVQLMLVRRLKLGTLAPVVVQICQP